MRRCERLAPLLPTYAHHHDAAHAHHARADRDAGREGHGRGVLAGHQRPTYAHPRIFEILNFSYFLIVEQKVESIFVEGLYFFRVGV